MTGIVEVEMDSGSLHIGYNARVVSKVLNIQEPGLYQITIKESNKGYRFKVWGDKFMLYQEMESITLICYKGLKKVFPNINFSKRYKIVEVSKIE